MDERNDYNSLPLQPIQTAVEWLFDNLKSHFEHDGDLFETVCMSYAIAKLKEKEQIIEAWIATDNELQRIAAEEYYNQRYNQNK